MHLLLAFLAAISALALIYFSLYGILQVITWFLMWWRELPVRLRRENRLLKQEVNDLREELRELQANPTYRSTGSKK